jgi:hypothetical protein
VQPRCNRLVNEVLTVRIAGAGLGLAVIAPGDDLSWNARSIASSSKSSMPDPATRLGCVCPMNADLSLADIM